MILTLSVFFVLAQDTSLVFSGRNRQLNISIPRVDTTVAIDGDLSEPIWRRASRLTDFSQYQPVDGRPAAEPTEVLVWYASDAIYFGIRARGGSGNAIRATQANRDNIGAEDHVQILLDTYNDRRIAFLFGVNALGVQQDGTRSDTFAGGAGGRSGASGFGNMNPLDGNVDLNPDFVFESNVLISQADGDPGAGAMTISTGFPSCLRWTSSRRAIFAACCCAACRAAVA